MLLAGPLSGGKRCTHLTLLGCVSPAATAFDDTRCVLALASELRHAKFPVMKQRVVDPNLQLVKQLTDDLTDIKKSLKDAEQASARFAGAFE